MPPIAVPVFSIAPKIFFFATEKVKVDGDSTRDVELQCYWSSPLPDVVSASANCSSHLLEEGTGLEASFKHVVYVCVCGEGEELIESVKKEEKSINRRPLF